MIKINKWFLIGNVKLDVLELKVIIFVLVLMIIDSVF